ncbi:MAG: hypothetical protein JWL77_6102 [Chthonomonadaceae bacterium]|nr:hypothetical protein [Chthonomonadaceae bacterium]
MFRTPGAPEEHHGNEADVALRQGLHRLPVPEVASDFDARVHAALCRPTPWWRLLWAEARPVLSTAACSLLVTLAALKGWDVSQRPLQPADSRPFIAARAWERKDLLESSDLSNTNVPLRGFATLR